MRAAAGMALATGLALAGCGYAPPPDGYAPARDFDCGPLIGDWAIADAADQHLLAPLAKLPDGARFNYLSIEDDAAGQLRMVLRRRVGDVVAEATTLRLRRPDDYRLWRAHVLGEPPPEIPAYYAPEDAGPVVDLAMAPAYDRCEGDWRVAASPGHADPSDDEPPVAQNATLALALDENRNLLVQQRISREHDTGFSFFDQHVTYFTYSHSEWHRLLAVSPAEARATVPASALPPVPAPIERLEYEIARRKAISDVPLWFRDHLPAGNEITLFRELQFDPAALSLPPDQVRFELAGRYRAEIAEPFTPVLRRHPNISAIEVRESTVAPGSRRYVRIEFTFTVEPRSLR